MSRHFGGPGNYERDFRKAESEVEARLATVQKSWNAIGLFCLFACAFTALCLWVRYGW